MISTITPLIAYRYRFLDLLESFCRAFSASSIFLRKENQNSEMGIPREFLASHRDE